MIPKIIQFIKFNRGKLAIVALMFLIGVAGWILVRGPSVVDPKSVLELEGDAGYSTIRWLFRYDDVFEVVGRNENVMQNIESDIINFARKTRPEFSDAQVLVGFTFNSKHIEESGTFIFTGYYYDLKDEIEVRLTPHGHGVFTLSITNLKDGTNIDNDLGMNGRRNEYIRKLPINKTFYSIRYLLGNDRIAVTFYEGYTSKDIEDVVLSLDSDLGRHDGDDISFTINAVGTVGLEQVKQNLIQPIQP